MKPECIRVLSRITRAQIEAMGMQSINQSRKLIGDSPAYGEMDFCQLIGKHN